MGQVIRQAVAQNVEAILDPTRSQYTDPLLSDALLPIDLPFYSHFGQLHSASAVALDDGCIERAFRHHNDKFRMTIQVLSLVGLGADLLHGEAGIRWAKQANDLLIEIVTHLTDIWGSPITPLTPLEASTDELERCIKELEFRGAMVHGATERALP